MRASAYPLAEVDDVAALVLEHTPVLGVERVALAHCVGRVVAEDLLAPQSLPALASSAVDGYAVRAADAGKSLRVLGESAAGRPFAGKIEPGTAARILTGGILPDGADCVACGRCCHHAPRTVHLLESDDVRMGEVLLERYTQEMRTDRGDFAAKVMRIRQQLDDCLARVQVRWGVTGSSAPPTRPCGTTPFVSVWPASAIAMGRRKRRAVRKVSGSISCAIAQYYIDIKGVSR